jgi:hypothetical protein
MDSRPPLWTRKNIIPKGMYWIAADDFPQIPGNVVIHLEDRLNMTNHPDADRFVGCCGPSAGLVNQLCKCGAEVATEVSDCWTGYYLHFEPGATELEQSQST